MAVVSRAATPKSTVLRVGGGITALVSLAVCLFLLFRPVACSFVTSFQLVIWAALFLAGTAAFFTGLALSRKGR